MSTVPAAENSPAFDALLDYLKSSRGFDFTAYKRASLARRVEKRMAAVRVEGFVDYADYLEVNPEELDQLFNAILINVTSFFRDEPAWEYLRHETIPMLADATRDGRPLRVWTAGCASGEEAYSMAMALADVLGRDAFRERVKIYATDIDEQALNEARAAVYPEKRVQLLPPEVLDRYFTRGDAGYLFDKDLRRAVIFGRHDLIQDAPISRVDILSCRNTLMYFNKEVQIRILARFHFALSDTGTLLLGKAEGLPTQAQMFVPIDMRRRVFRKAAGGAWRDRPGGLNRAAVDETNDRAPASRLHLAAFGAAPNAQLVVDASGRLALFNEDARGLFGLAPTDLGRPVQDLELSYRPIEMRSLISQVTDQQRPVTLKEDVEWSAPGCEARYYEVRVVPLIERGDSQVMGVALSFSDTTRAHELQLQLDRSKHDLEAAYEDLQSTNEELQTTNEELQSTVEELDTTNEELQSTNEELETMNEELRSTNEELQTTNDELRQRSDDLDHTNAFLESVITGVRSGVVVVDLELQVIAWNHRAEDLWGLRADEARGQNFLSLDIGLPADQLRSGIHSCLAGEQEHSEVVVKATNRRGRAITCRVSSTPLLGSSKEVRGAIVMIDEQPTSH
ncbi:MAG: PAS domain S-box protein [Luteitalea sp.]|nr:PAS domain S-box protein [Luteitalea sp.]